jgi:hypothetical protein
MGGCVVKLVSREKEKIIALFLIQLLLTLELQSWRIANGTKNDKFNFIGLKNDANR